MFMKIFKEQSNKLVTTIGFSILLAIFLFDYRADFLQGVLIGISDFFR